MDSVNSEAITLASPALLRHLHHLSLYLSVSLSLSFSLSLSLSLDPARIVPLVVGSVLFWSDVIPDAMHFNGRQGMT